MKEYVRILRNENLMDLASIDVMDGRRKRKHDIASRTSGHKYASHSVEIRPYVRSHHSNRRWVTELPLRIHRAGEEG